MAEKTPDAPYDWAALGQRVQAEIKATFLPRCSPAESAVVTKHLMSQVRFTPKTMYPSQNKLFTGAVSENCPPLLHWALTCFVFGMAKASKLKKIEEYVKSNPNALDKFQIGKKPCVQLPKAVRPPRVGEKRKAAEADVSGGADDAEGDDSKDDEDKERRVKSKTGSTQYTFSNRDLNTLRVEAQYCDADLDNPNTTAKDDDVDIGSRKTELHERKIALDAREAELKDHEISLKDRESVLENRESSLEDREARLSDRETALEDYEAKLKDPKAGSDSREAPLKNRDFVLNSLEAELNNREAELENRGTKLNDFETELDDREAELEDRATALDSIETDMSNRQAGFSIRKASLDNFENDLKNREVELNHRKAVLESSELDFEKRETKLKEQKVEMSNRKSAPRDRKSQLESDCKEEHVEVKVSTHTHDDRLFNQNGNGEYQKFHSDAILSANAGRVLFDIAVSNVPDTECREKLTERYKEAGESLYSAINLCYRISLQMDGE